LSSSRDFKTAAKIASLVALDWPLADLRTDPTTSDFKDRTMSSKQYAAPSRRWVRYL